VADPDVLHVKVYGIDQPIFDPTLLRRESMGRLMDYLYAMIGAPFLAEVTETDGTVTTGWIDLTQTEPPQTDDAAPEKVLEPEPALGAEPDQDAIDPAASVSDGEPAYAARHAVPGGEADIASLGSPEFNFTIAGDGFIPGEDVVLAFIASATHADCDGGAVVQVPRSVVRALPTGEVVLFGRASGTLTVHQPDAGR
jgi:hypothetical protein